MSKYFFEQQMSRCDNVDLAMSQANYIHIIYINARALSPIYNHLQDILHRISKRL